MTVRSRAQHHRRVHDVGRAADAAELSCLSRAVVVQWLDADPWRPKQSREPNLSAPITPDLCDHGGWYRERLPVPDAPSQNRHHPPVVALEGDERAAVQGESRHASARARPSHAETKRPVGLAALRRGETPHLFEMGIPIAPWSVPWHCDVQQRVPLTQSRDLLPERFVLAVKATLLEAMIAMAILAGALTWVSVGVIRAMRSETHAKMITTATALARSRSRPDQRLQPAKRQNTAARPA